MPKSHARFSLSSKCRLSAGSLPLFLVFAGFLASSCSGEETDQPIEMAQEALTVGKCPTFTVNQACACSDANFQGTCVILDSAKHFYPTSQQIGIPNDWISSIVAGDNVNVRYCVDGEMAGACATLYGQPNGARLAVMSGTPGNDSVSSMRIDLKTDNCWAPGARQISVFTDANWGGDCAVLTVPAGASQADFPGTSTASNSQGVGGSFGIPNDWMSSLILGSGVSADLFQHGQMGGQVYHYENGPAAFNLAGWSNDDVSSLRVKIRTANRSYEVRKTYTFSASATASATNSAAPLYSFGTLPAGTTLRFGTCATNGELRSAKAVGDTLVRLYLNGADVDYDDDTCDSRASFMSYTLPHTATVAVRVGCWGDLSCSGTFEIIWDAPDSNGSIANVPAAFAAITGDAPRRNKLAFLQNNLVVGAYTYHVAHEPHFQGVQRIPRTLSSTSDSTPRFMMSASDNADLFTVSITPKVVTADGLVGSAADPTNSASKVIGVESNTTYLDNNGRGHLGGVQLSGRWLGGGIEKQGQSGPSTIKFWDVASLPNPRLVRAVDNPNASAGEIALTKKTGKNKGYLMLAGGLSCSTAQVWTLDGPHGYADLATGAWYLHPQPVTIPCLDGSHEFQSLNFVNQDDGSLFLVGMVGSGTGDPEGGADTAVLMQVFGDPDNLTVQQVASKVFTCHFDSARQCGFNAATGVFVDPAQNAIRIYATRAYRPDDSNSSITAVEFY